MVIIITVLTFAMTLLGGLFALRFRDKLHLILGFSAGAVIGVAFFDLLPEALQLGQGRGTFGTLTIVALGFVLYMLLDRVFSLHAHHDHEDNTETNRSTLRAGSLSFHSFLDGLAIGLSFHVSNALGIVVALAVLAHDFSDGINTVSAILKSGGTRARAFKWLLVDAIAPVAGIGAAFLFSVSDTVLGTLLALFGGFFLYIGASDLVPESYHHHPTKWTTLMTVLGMALIFVIIHLAG